MRRSAASSGAFGARGVAGGMFAGRLAYSGCDVVGGTAAAWCAATGGIIGGLGDRLRALAGGRARMMPLRGWAAAASSGRKSKVGKENIKGVLGKLV